VSFAPAAALVALLILAALVTPWLGGPEIVLPSARETLSEALGEASAAGALTLILALLVSRVRAGWRSWKGEVVLGRPFPAAGRDLLRLFPRALLVFAGMFFLRVLMTTFLGFKRAIPEFQPYGPRDVQIARLDHLLHGGADPWTLLQPLLGHPWITAAIDLVYVRTWYFASVLALVALTFWLRGGRRTQFLLAFAGTWVFLGIVVATALSSVGPCYYDRVVGGPSSFTPLMTYLRTVDGAHVLDALGLQEQLWQAYVTGDRGLVAGISAMPSLHVAMPTLFAVASWHRMRALSIAFWAYAALIFVGSVHLGWHYAVDGYASVLLVFPVWWASGQIARRWYQRTREWRARGRVATTAAPA
jgi:hypothetical protein